MNHFIPDQKFGTQSNFCHTHWVPNFCNTHWVQRHSVVGFLSCSCRTTSFHKWIRKFLFCWRNLTWIETLCESQQKNWESLMPLSQSQEGERGRTFQEMFIPQFIVSLMIQSSWLRGVKFYGEALLLKIQTIRNHLTFGSFCLKYNFIITIYVEGQLHQFYFSFLKKKKEAHNPWQKVKIYIKGDGWGGVWNYVHTPKIWLLKLKSMCVFVIHTIWSS